MGEVRKMPPVKYFVGFIFSGDAGLKEAMEKISARYGSFDLVSGVIPFEFTGYYREEMGDGLFRSFACLEALGDPALLPDFKHFTNSLEMETADRVKVLPPPRRDGKREGPGLEIYRRVNLDPGYLEPGKLVLASTKNHKHRIYLRDGIFAEVTRYWSKGDFHSLDHTYPDYSSPFAGEFFRRAMARYREQLGTAKKP